MPIDKEGEWRTTLWHSEERPIQLEKYVIHKISAGYSYKFDKELTINDVEKIEELHSFMLQRLEDAEERIKNKHNEE